MKEDRKTKTKPTNKSEFLKRMCALLTFSVVPPLCFPSRQKMLHHDSFKRRMHNQGFPSLTFMGIKR